ncbi:MAG: beta-lactamase family protein [Vicinamibacteria bacterium]|nr:beta-lactamase family protein [Vicinamibacteria bacterium]
MILRYSRIAALATALAPCLTPSAVAAQPQPGRASSAAEEVAPAARFADPDRGGKLARAFPEIDRAFLDYAPNVPGLAWGVIIDGELVHSGAAGLRDLGTNAKAAPDSIFRIASMTKNFTAMAVMKLRDAGRLSLDEPAARYVPELRNLKYPTTDSPAITLRHLLSHSAGFPEDNPWGDRQLAETDATLSAWMRAGFPFSQAPGMGYEYSNTGFALLGQVVARVSGMPARDYIDREILEPLGMNSTRWEAASVPRNRIAHGYGRPDGSWTAETPLSDGSYGVMGGLYSSVPDLARLVALYLSAYPARNGEDKAPLKRSSLREMQSPHSPYRSTALRASLTAPLSLSSGGYAFGLGATQTCRFANVVAHSGGLPGYGSQMRWLPEYGVGVVALANGTYAGPGRAVAEAFEALARTGALKPRVPRPGAELLKAKSAVDHLVNAWSDDGLQKIAAINLLPDRSLEKRRKEFETLRRDHGACRAEGAIEAPNALRGSWTLACDKGEVQVRITLAPTTPPAIQYLETTSILPASAGFLSVAKGILRAINQGEGVNEALLSPSSPADLVAQLESARAYGQCVDAGLTSGGGDSGTRLFTCDRGNLSVRLTVEEEGRLKELRVVPAPGETCVPWSAARGESPVASQARDFSSDQGAEPKEYREYCEVRQRRTLRKRSASDATRLSPRARAPHRHLAIPTHLSPQNTRLQLQRPPSTTAPTSGRRGAHLAALVSCKPLLSGSLLCRKGRIVGEEPRRFFSGLAVKIAKAPYLSFMGSQMESQVETQEVLGG